jgi:hypothetical protein
VTKLLEVPKAVKLNCLCIENKLFKSITNYISKLMNNKIISINRFNSKYRQFLGYQMINESLSWLRDNELRYGKNPTDITMDNQQPSL